jgi:mono/diheme cytochrome c family protein
MKTLRTLAIFAIFALTLFSCQSNTYEDISPKNVTNPTYAKNIKPIFDANCVSCHSDGGSGQSPNLETYEQVKNGCENGKVICRIDDQSCGEVMPQAGRMPQSTIDLIKLWEAQGFVN